MVVARDDPDRNVLVVIATNLPVWHTTRFALQTGCDT